MRGKWQNEVGRQLWYLLPSKDMSLGNPNYYRAIGRRPSSSEVTISGGLINSMVRYQSFIRKQKRDGTRKPEFPDYCNEACGVMPNLA